MVVLVITVFTIIKQINLSNTDPDEMLQNVASDQGQQCLPLSSSSFNPCPAEQIKMPRPLLIFSQSDYLIGIVALNSHT